jgi:hypothetical protein
MSYFLKFVGGILVGAALGAGVYVVLTRKNETGLIAEAKTLLNNIVEEGKQAAETRRIELEAELGQKA